MDDDFFLNMVQITGHIDCAWNRAVGKQVVAHHFEVPSLIVFARKCLLHAFEVNRRFFKKQLPPECINSISKVLEAIEDVSRIADFPDGKELESTLFKIYDQWTDEEECLAGLGSLLQGIEDFLRFRDEGHRWLLFSAAGSAYDSVMTRAAADALGTTWNTGFGENDSEETNLLCVEELEYQRSLLT